MVKSNLKQKIFIFTIIPTLMLVQKNSFTICSIDGGLDYGKYTAFIYTSYKTPRNKFIRNV